MLIEQLESEKLKIIQWAQPQKHGWKENSIYLLSRNVLSFLIKTAQVHSKCKAHRSMLFWLGWSSVERRHRLDKRAGQCLLTGLHTVDSTVGRPELCSAFRRNDAFQDVLVHSTDQVLEDS